MESRRLEHRGEPILAGGPPMLVITRREGEEVIIGNPAAPLGIVRIAAIKGDRVRLAFEFPREIDVHRREVAEQINAADKDGNPIAGQIRPAAGGENA
jgi:carbon storage regulator